MKFGYIFFWGNLELEKKQEKFKLDYEQMKEQIEEIKRLDELTAQNQAERIKLDQDRDGKN